VTVLKFDFYSQFIHIFDRRWWTDLIWYDNSFALRKVRKYKALGKFYWNCCHMGTAIKHHVPDRVIKPSFVIWHLGTLLWRSVLSV